MYRIRGRLLSRKLSLFFKRSQNQIGYIAAGVALVGGGGAEGLMPVGEIGKEIVFLCSKDTLSSVNLKRWPPCRVT